MQGVGAYFTSVGNACVDIYFADFPVSFYISLFFENSNIYPTKGIVDAAEDGPTKEFW